MTGLRRAIIHILIFLAVFYNLERFEYDSQPLIDLQSFVYILVAGLVIVTLLWRKLQRLNANLALPVWLGIYLLLKLTLFTNTPLIGWIYTHLTIIEMAMVAIAGILTLNLTRAINETEEISDRTVFPKRHQRVKDLGEAEGEITTEVFRSRRHSRPLSVIVIEMDKFDIKKNLGQGLVNAQQMLMRRFALAGLGQSLGKVLRRTDLILEPDEQDGFIVLCPETGMESAAMLAQRIQGLAQKDLGMTVRCGAAAFSDETGSFEDLLQKARVDLLQPQAPADFEAGEPARAGE